MNISDAIEKMENSLGILFHFGEADDGMTMAEARHLAAIIQVDAVYCCEIIRDFIENAEDMDLAAMQARADLDEARAEIQRLTTRAEVAVKLLDVAGDEAITAHQQSPDTEIAAHITTATSRLFTAKRVLQGLHDLSESQTGRAS